MTSRRRRLDLGLASLRSKRVARDHGVVLFRLRLKYPLKADIRIANCWKSHACKWSGHLAHVEGRLARWPKDVPALLGRRRVAAILMTRFQWASDGTSSRRFQ